MAIISIPGQTTSEIATTEHHGFGLVVCALVVEAHIGKQLTRHPHENASTFIASLIARQNRSQYRVCESCLRICGGFAEFVGHTEHR